MDGNIAGFAVKLRRMRQLQAGLGPLARHSAEVRARIRIAEMEVDAALWSLPGGKYAPFGAGAIFMAGWELRYSQKQCRRGASPEARAVLAAREKRLDRMLADMPAQRKTLL